MIGDRAHLTLGQFGLETTGTGIGTAASNAGAPCSIRSVTACALPYILRLRSMMTTAPLCGIMTLGRPSSFWRRRP